MSDVKKCDETGALADNMNPAGWLRIIVQPYGIGQQQQHAADVASGDAAMAWLKKTLGELEAKGVAPVTADPSPPT